jgi:hypothetical protein|nr:MAG TPA: Protein of unknown function (DUF1642) [Caudoviricetes sp.]
MDKKELYDKVEDLDLFCLGIRKYVALSEVKYLIKQLDEPQKVVIPQYVADWIEYCKNISLSLARALNVSEEDFYNYANQKDHIELLTFLGSMVNQEKFSKAWLFGYEVEKEKKYLVKIKRVSGYGRYLNKILSSGEYFLASENEVDGYRTKHTREELEQDNFGWVFSCEGVEVKEVE